MRDPMKYGKAKGIVLLQKYLPKVTPFKDIDIINTLDEWEQYEPHHRARMAIKPGITGMWQVSGRSDITDFEEVVQLDTEYIEKWNLGLDIKILFKTVFNVLKNDGAV